MSNLETLWKSLIVGFGFTFGAISAIGLFGKLVEILK
jgi:hypothetical protein